VPVLACPPTTTYRIGKFVRRHRGGVAAASAAAVMLLVVAAMTLVQARRVARERDRANAEALTATQVSDFLAGLFKVSDPSESRGKTLTAQELLERGTSRIESELASQPEVQARLLMTLAGVYEGLGMFAKQGELAEKAHAIRSRLVGADAQDTVNALNMVASSRYKRGQYDEAERMWKQVLERTRANLGTNDRVYLVALSNYSSVLAALGRWKEAEVTTREALDASRRLFGETSSRAVTSMANLGAILQMVDKPAEAQTYYRAAIEESRKQRGADHPGTLVYMSNLAESLEDQGKLAESESLHREVLTARRRVLPAQHSSTAVSLVNLASVLNQRHQYVEAEAFAREALDIFQKNTAADYWQIAHATTVVAEAQLGQNRSADVGPALIAAAERILASAEPWPSAKRRAIRRVVDFYTATGDVQHAAAWRSKLPSAPSPSS
jgi:tetratricopeptide (TPR) repeat protein